jgi:hypothetical protein
MRVLNGDIDFTSLLPKRVPVPWGYASHYTKELMDNNNITVEEVCQYMKELSGGIDSYAVVYAKMLSSYLRKDIYNTTQYNCDCYVISPDGICKHIVRARYLSKIPDTVESVIDLINNISVGQVDEDRKEFEMTKKELQTRLGLCYECYSPHTLPMGCCTKRLCVDCWRGMEERSLSGSSPSLCCREPMPPLVEVLMAKFKANR